MSDAYGMVDISGDRLPPELRNLVLSRWMRSLRFGNDYFRLMVPESFYASYQRFINRILSDPDAVVRFAVLADDRDVVLGFAVSRAHVLDYVHVHKDQRRQGIAAALMSPQFDTITHLTRTGLTIWGSKRPEWKFDPFA